MGIDRIGNAGKLGGITPPSATGVSESSGPEAFSVHGEQRATEVDATSPLARLRAGQIDLDGYLDARIEQATAHLVGRVDGERLAFIRSTLRSELEQDPAFSALVQRATGSAKSSFDRG